MSSCAAFDTPGVRSWYGRLSGSGQTTAAKCYRLLKAILTTAVEEGLILANPCTLKGAGHEPQSDRTMLTAEQVDALADEVGDRYRAVVLLAAWAGLRFGELAALTRSRLDFDAGTVTVAGSASEMAQGVRLIRPPKTQAGRRVVAIPPHVLPALVHHLDAYAESGRDGLVFVRPKGGRLRNANFGRSVWRPARERAGVPGSLTFHDLRGVSATLAARAGATTKDLMLRLGHSTPAMALRYQRAEAVRDATIALAMSEGRGTGEAQGEPEATESEA